MLALKNVLKGWRRKATKNGDGSKVQIVHKHTAAEGIQIIPPYPLSTYPLPLLFSSFCICSHLLTVFKTSKFNLKCFVIISFCCNQNLKTSKHKTYHQNHTTQQFMQRRREVDLRQRLEDDIARGRQVQTWESAGTGQRSANFPSSLFPSLSFVFV